jgi:hypothetical protein
MFHDAIHGAAHDLRELGHMTRDERDVIAGQVVDLQALREMRPAQVASRIPELGERAITRCVAQRPPA